MSEFQTVTNKFNELRVSLTKIQDLKRSNILRMIKHMSVVQIEEIFTYQNEMYIRLILDAINKM